MVSRLLLAEDRGQPLRRVGLDHPREEVEARFVLENKHPALAVGAPPQLRPGLVAPASDRLVVPLDGPLDRLLGRPVQPLEQPADVTLVVADAELLLDDAADTGAGPDLAAEAIRLRPVPEEFGDRSDLRRGELGSPPRGGSRPERLGAAGAGTSQPAAEGLLGNIEGLGDIALIPTAAIQVQGTESPPLETLGRDGWEDVHPSILL
jgi:hypothetical protein